MQPGETDSKMLPWDLVDYLNAIRNELTEVRYAWENKEDPEEKAEALKEYQHAWEDLVNLWKLDADEYTDNNSLVYL